MPRPSDPLARIKLLAAAEVEFVEHGLDGAKVEQITRRAGISKGAFYLHFSSKTQLFRELVEAFVARLAALTDASIDQCQLQDCCTPDALIDQWVTLDVEVFEFLWQNRGLIRLLLEGGSGAQFRYLVDDFLERLASKSRHVLEQGVTQGIYREDLDLDLAANFIAGAYDRLAHDIVRQSSRPDFRPVLEGMQKLVLFGLASTTFIETYSHQRGLSPGSEPPSRVRTARPSPSTPAGTTVDSTVPFRAPKSPRKQSRGSR